MSHVTRSKATSATSASHLYRDDRQKNKRTGLGSPEGAGNLSSLVCLKGELLLPLYQPECAESTSFRYINGLQLRDILEGNYCSIYNKSYIIDCRFAYEYAGGHIRGAENHWAHETIDTLLFSNLPPSDETVVILYCEYSESRAPRMANYIRARDRLNNEAQYPYLTYPTIWILKGGYRSFYDVHNTLCEPRGYIAERDGDPSKEIGKVPTGLESRKRFKNIKISRAKSNLIDKLRNARVNTTKGDSLGYVNSA